MAIDNPESAPGNTPPGSGVAARSAGRGRRPVGRARGPADCGPDRRATTNRRRIRRRRIRRTTGRRPTDRRTGSRDTGSPATAQVRRPQPCPPPAPSHAGGARPRQHRRRRPGRALLGGGIGGYVGYESAAAAATGTSTGVLADPLPPADPNATPLGPVEAVAARVLPSVVQLQVEGVRAAGEGSGIVLSADGLLLTNNHVVEAAANGGRVVALFQDGTSAPAQIVGRDPSSDLAVLRAQGVSGLTPVTLGNSDSLRVGQQVVAFGAPLGLGGTVTTGIISALNRAVSVGQESGASEATVLSAVQTDAAINPGNSGGPLVDMQGALVGINSAIATTGAQGGSIGVGFAIPINQAKRVAEELERTGRATRAVLGVALATDGRDGERRNDRPGHPGWPGRTGGSCGPERWSPEWTIGLSPMGTNSWRPFETMRRAIASL